MMMNTEGNEACRVAAGRPERRGLLQRKKTSTCRPSAVQQLLHFTFAAAVALTSYFVATHFMFQAVVVDGNSMKPTLHNADRYMLNRIEYLFRLPQASDIVVIRDPEDGSLAVKRIVAIPGQSIELAGGNVYVNGVKLRESYLPPGTRTFGYRAHDHEKFACGQGQYFVLGDNRGNSADSRIYGPVSRKNILGVVVP